MKKGLILIVAVIAVLVLGFIICMNELSITENKISQMRKHYNKNVTDYKRFVRQFPSKQILSVRGYEIKDYERLTFENSSVDAPRNLFGNSEKNQ